MRAWTRKKADANQPRIVEALRKAGCLVQHLHTVGGGCPDLLVGRQGRLFLLEVKDGAQPKNKQALNDAELEWHRAWGSYQVHVVLSVEDALRVVGATS